MMELLVTGHHPRCSIAYKVLHIDMCTITLASDANVFLITASLIMNHCLAF